MNYYPRWADMKPRDQRALVKCIKGDLQAQVEVYGRLPDAVMDLHRVPKIHPADVMQGHEGRRVGDLELRQQYAVIVNHPAILAALEKLQADRLWEEQKHISNGPLLELERSGRWEQHAVKNKPSGKRNVVGVLLSAPDGSKTYKPSNKKLSSLVCTRVRGGTAAKGHLLPGLLYGAGEKQDQEEEEGYCCCCLYTNCQHGAVEKQEQ